MISIADFLALTGANNPGNEAQSQVKLATIDPAYTTGNPKVTFDGESTLSTRGYVVLGGYVPIPGDRALLVRTGNTWLVIGGLTAPTPISAQVSAAAKIKSTVAQSLTTSTIVTKTFNTAVYDTDGMVDLANNQLVVQTAGIYSIKGRVRANITDGARVQARFIINGATHIGIDDRVAPSGTFGWGTDADRNLAVGDTVRFGVYQEGVTLNDAPLEDLPSLSAAWVAPPP